MKLYVLLVCLVLLALGHNVHAHPGRTASDAAIIAKQIVQNRVCRKDSDIVITPRGRIIYTDYVGRVHHFGSRSLKQAK